jgi:hypothetical protein
MHSIGKLWRTLLQLCVIDDERRVEHNAGSAAGVIS